MILKPKTLLKIKRGKSVIRDIALKLDLIPGHQDYTKFIILCRSRTGSNLLLNQLQFHQNIRMFYEIFSQDNSSKEFWDYINYDLQNIRDLKQNNPLELVNSFVYRAMPLEVKAVGFKLFYYHARSGKQQEIWQYLKDRQEIKIIHLVRRNLLKTYVSQQLALTTNSWYSKGDWTMFGLGDRQKHTPAIQLNYEKTLAALAETNKLEQKNEYFFKDHQLLKIFYEDLVEDNTKEMAKVQNFLEVKPTSVYISTKKQSPNSLQKSIQNYAELKNCFQGSPYASFFK
ncbi:MAG TPA: sulfotransferase domain-containing protein [Coleofasciculaceae cyanobacterium]|jgi:LPS sulfotransferase NodH